MNREAEKILDSIEFPEKEATLFDLRQRVLVATIDQATQIIEELRIKGKAHFVGQNLFENQPYYYFLEAYANYKVPGQQEDAIDRADRAASLFRMHQLLWNEALTHWFLNILYDEHSRKEEACKELQMAISILEGMAGGFQHDGRVQDCQSCQAILRQLYRYVNLTASEDVLDVTPAKNAYLVPSWIPVYEKVQHDNENKPSWANPRQDVDTEIQLIIIGDTWYSIKSVKPDHEMIIVDGSKEYGWVKILDNEMNTSQPTPIEEGDYALFIKFGEVGKHLDFKENSYVVASQWSHDLQGFKYVVRTLGKKALEENFLYSENERIGDRNKPIQVGGNTQILGHVIAIAKPLKRIKKTN